MPRIFDLRLADGSRHFGALPEHYDVHAPEWHRLRAHVAALDGAIAGGFVTDDVTEAWIDFTYAGHQLSLNNQQGEWWFFVADPACPDAVLARVLDHFEPMLDPIVAHARGCGAIQPGHYRVVVLEPDGRVSHADFGELSAARQHAADAAHEADDDRGSALAYVLDDGLARR